MVITISEFARHIKNMLVFDRNYLQRLFITGFILLLFLATHPVNASGAGHEIVSGYYEGLMVAIDKEGKVTGYFEQSIGVGVTRTCSFFLKGQVVSGAMVNIVAWSGPWRGPEDRAMPGVIKPNADSVYLKIKGADEELAGCITFMGSFISDGTDFSRNYESQWTSIKMVSKDRAYIYSEPSLKKKTKAYFIKDDVVGIIAANQEWVQVFYPRFEKSTIKGWLKRSDVDDLEPPLQVR
jgi:hypothetical protein